jgi:hypothetical protein
MRADIRIILSFIFLQAFAASAQTGSPSLKGRVRDSLSGQELAFSTATIYKADTSILTFKLSNPAGYFSIPGLPLNTTLRVIVTYSGYKAFRKEFTLSKESVQLDLGDIFLSNDIRSLDEILVVAERPPIVVRKDTIEYNAAAFKMLPSALLEDLLRKLPGVDADKDGNISVNGKRVNRILVDGRDFFGTDMKIATRNLPANVIDKVQVADDGEERERNPDAAVNAIGKIINLKLKKSIKKGWFGKLYGGGGNHDRYEAGGIVNTFADTLQVSLLGFGNNINKAGFGLGDLQSIGGFKRTGMTGTRRIENGIQVNGVSLGGTGQGIQQTAGGGMNLNHDIGKKLTINLQYFYGKVKSHVDESGYFEQKFDKGFLTNRSENNNVLTEETQRVGATLRWKPDAKTSLTYRPAFAWQHNPTLSHQHAMVSNQLFDPLNRTDNLLDLNSRNTMITQDLIFTRNFNKRGRSLMSSLNIISNKTKSSAYNSSDIIFYDKVPNVSNAIDQLRKRDNGRSVFNWAVQYAEPVGKQATLRFSNTLERTIYEDAIYTFKPVSGGNGYAETDSAFTNTLNRRSWKNTTSAGISFTKGAFRFSPSLGYQVLRYNNRFAKGGAPRQDFSFVIPRLTIEWKEITLGYMTTIAEPAGNDIQPVVNNTNPLYLYYGNINLSPVYSQTVYIDYQHFNYQKGSSSIIYVTGGFDNDAIVYSRITDSTGVQSILPVNVNGAWNAGASVSLSRLIKKSNNIQVSLRATLNPNYYNSIVVVNGIKSYFKNFSMSPSFTLSYNHKDGFEINEKYIVGVSNSSYSNSYFANQRIVSHTLQSEFIVRRPKHFVWETTFEFISNPVLRLSGQPSIARWNAAVNYLFLKDDKAQLRLHVFDILNRNSSITRVIRENYLYESRVNVLQQYFMLTLSYNIRNFRTRKVGGKDSLLFY